jgi:anti-sigma B factor antagonist
MTPLVPLHGAPGVALSGDVDMAAVPEVEEALEAAIRESAGALVVDLTRVAFIDSTGLQVLLRARALLGREDRALVLVCPHGPVRRVFELAGVSDVFAFYATPAAAAAHLTPRPGPARG